MDRAESSPKCTFWRLVTACGQKAETRAAAVGALSSSALSVALLYAMAEGHSSNEDLYGLPVFAQVLIPLGSCVGGGALGAIATCVVKAVCGVVHRGCSNSDSRRLEASLRTESVPCLTTDSSDSEGYLDP